MDKSTHQGDLSALFDRARRDASPIYAVALTGNPDHDFVILRNGRDGLDQIVDLDSYRDAPRKIKASPTFDEVECLIDYIRIHHHPETKAYFSRLHSKIVVLFDDNGKDAPSWRKHSATLVLTHTPQWKRWLAISGKMLDQVEFAEFIEEHGTDITDPSYAHMLEIASSLQISRSGTFKSALRLGSGEHSFMLTEEHAVKTGVASVVIPTDIKLALAPYEGSPPYVVNAKFRYRLHEGALKLGIKLLRTDDIIRECQDEVAGHVGKAVEGVEMPVFFGHPFA
jgi:uncharacterized protein YfdQ (DUF2303 family)